MLQMMEEFQQALARLPYLRVTPLHGGFQIRLLLRTDTGLLNLELEAIDQLPVGDHRRHHHLKPVHPPGHVVIALAHAVNLWSVLMMEERPIQTNDLSLPTLMLGCNHSPMTGQKSFRIPARL